MRKIRGAFSTFTIPHLSPAAIEAMTEYCAHLVSVDEANGLSYIFGEAVSEQGRTLIAAALIYRNDAEMSVLYRVIGKERGKFADPRLCLVADELGLNDTPTPYTQV